jgi:hypothetical protein
MERRLVIGLGAALAVALLAIAFLLGRESRRANPAVVAPTAGPTAEPPLLSPTGVPAAAPDTVPPTPIAVMSEEGAPSPSAVPPAAAPAPVETLPATEDPVRAEVARYFAEVEALQQASKGWSGDPNAAAQQILRQATSGDMSGFKSLADANRRLAEQLRAVSVPEPCALHHQRTLEVLDAATGLVDKMPAAVQSGDVAALGAVTTQGQDLERRTREVDALGLAVKKRYGL